MAVWLTGCLHGLSWGLIKGWMALVMVVISSNDGYSGHSKVLTRLFGAVTEYPVQKRDGSVVSWPAEHLLPTTDIEGRL